MTRAAPLALLLSALCASPALSHGAAPAVLAAEPSPPSLSNNWTFDGWWLALLAIVCVAYGWGVRNAWARAGVGEGIRWSALLAFIAAWLTLIVALASPLDAWSEQLFSAHAAQHELLMLVAAPLLVLGRPLIAYLWALPPRWRQPVASITRRPPVRRVWRFLTAPLVALGIHALVRWAWHAPVLFEAALFDERIHAVQHATFFFSASLFWWSLLHGRYGRAGYGVGVLFVFITAMHAGLLGALITFADRIWYAENEVRAVAVAVNALEDQRLAGVVMWVPAGVVFMVSALALFLAWLGESERRDAHPPVHSEEL